MSIFTSIILGIVQGLTEFLPISSTAHLTIAGKVLGLIDPSRPEEWTAYIAVMQMGTLLAVIIYFFKDLIGITRGFVVDGIQFIRTPAKGPGNARMGWYIILGTLPVATIGILLKKIIEGRITKNLTVIGISLIALALILWFAEEYGSRTKKINDATWLDSFLIGCAQALALIPGSSRSGTTITAALLLGISREDAARFSFLLSSFDGRHPVIASLFALHFIEISRLKFFGGRCRIRRSRI